MKTERGEDMTLQNVEVRPKIKRQQYDNKEVFDKSSDVTVYNLHDQSWHTLDELKLTHLWRKVQERKGER
ncbi:hypothetical protein FHR85_002564 [Alkalibacillus almallahensis]|nr:hypothetical protein [Alkalibacillus almallahensis]